MFEQDIEIEIELQKLIGFKISMFEQKVYKAGTKRTLHMKLCWKEKSILVLFPSLSNYIKVGFGLNQA